MDRLPIIDCAHIDTDPGGVAAELDATFRGTGFCYVRNIGVSQELVDGVFAASRQFHAQPEPAKRALAMNGTHRGYMAPNTSVIVTSSVAAVKRPNFSESLMVMHEVDEADPRFGTEVHGPNQWPELPGFRTAVTAYEAGMKRVLHGDIAPDGDRARSARRLPAAVLRQADHLPAPAALPAATARQPG